MKGILNLVESYLRKFPAPSSVELIESSLLKLGYTYSTPYTDSSSVKEKYYPIREVSSNKVMESVSSKLNYNQKGRIEEAGTFQSILVAEKHQKLLQDDVFGKAKLSQDRNRWVYVAQVKEEKVKSYFVKGSGKAVYQHDFGQTYDDVRDAKIFVWDKKKKQVFKIETDRNLIPACPIFGNKEGSKIIFHAYKKSQFGHGLLHCFNRDVAIHEVEIQINDQLEDAEKQQEKVKEKTKAEKQRLKNLEKMIDDGFRTNIFPNITECFNYLVYCSGQGTTHTHYLDLVVMKRDSEGWKQIHRFKDQLVGYYCTLKLFPSTSQEGRPICYFQTIDKALQKIYCLDIEKGEISEVSKGSPGQVFAISEVLESGVILGTTSTHNYRTFFYNKQKGQKLSIVPPIAQQKFLLQQLNDPIPGFYLEAHEDEILQEYRERSKKRPLVLLAHGGPHGAVDPSLTLLRYSLLKMGYGLLMPNFSGSVGYGQKYLEGSLKSVGQTDAQEIICLLKKLLQQKLHLDSKNVHVYGGSYGGYMGAIMGSRYSEYFKSAIILNGVLNIGANLFFTDIPQWNTVEALGKQELHMLKQEDYIQMFKQSPISQPMKIPTLQFLGAKDRRVPYRQGLIFDAMTKRNGTPIQTYVYQNSAHSLADSVQTSIDLIVKSLLFLEDLQGSQDSQNKMANEEKKQSAKK